jgi:uncharacterized membrane protein YeiH
MLLWFDYFGVIIFAITGCLVAARRRVDMVGFLWLATVTAIGGGTLRDMILDRPVFWLKDPVYLPLCFITAAVLFFTAHHIHRRLRLILWADALGLAVFAVIGTDAALTSGANVMVALTMGVVTATFGGVVRDLLAGEPTLIMRREIYVTAALASSLTYFLLFSVGISATVSVPVAVALGFGLRGLGLRYRLTLPGYKKAAKHTPERRNG